MLDKYCIVAVFQGQSVNETYGVRRLVQKMTEISITTGRQAALILYADGVKRQLILLEVQDIVINTKIYINGISYYLTPNVMVINFTCSYRLCT